MRRLVVAASAALALAGAAPASAHDWRMERAQLVAAVAWHNPCAGRVQVVRGTPPGEPASVGGFVLAAVPVGSCTVVLNDRLRFAWSGLCQVMLHEYGHLAGYRDSRNASDPAHSRNPLSVMYHDPGGWVDHGTYGLDFPDRRCAHRGRPYLTQAFERFTARSKHAKR